MPATAKFLHAVAALPQGAVVLPGLDTDLDDEAWQLIGGATDAHGKVSAAASNHPQFAMHALLDRFGLKRSDVEPLGTPAPHGRKLLMSEAMRPSNGTRAEAGGGGLPKSFFRFGLPLAEFRAGKTSTLQGSEPRTRFKDEDLDKAQWLIACLQGALSPLDSIDPPKPHDFSELAERH